MSRVFLFKAMVASFMPDPRIPAQLIGRGHTKVSMSPLIL